MKSELNRTLIVSVVTATVLSSLIACSPNRADRNADQPGRAGLTEDSIRPAPVPSSRPDLTNQPGRVGNDTRSNSAGSTPSAAENATSGSGAGTSTSSSGGSGH